MGEGIPLMGKLSDISSQSSIAAKGSSLDIVGDNEQGISVRGAGYPKGGRGCHGWNRLVIFHLTTSLAAKGLSRDIVGDIEQGNDVMVAGYLKCL